MDDGGVIEDRKDYVIEQREPHEAGGDGVRKSDGEGHHYAAEKSDPAAEQGHERTTEHLFVHSGDFVKGFKPPDYIVKRMMQRGFFYSWTAPTGHAKTLIALLLALAIGHSGKFGPVAVKLGRVGYFALENPDDIRTRWIALCDHHRVGPSDVDVYFCTVSVDPKSIAERVAVEDQRVDGFDLIIIDTGSAMFSGTDTNADAEMIPFCQDLRKLTELPKRPCVLAMMHPVKNPSRDNLIPKGAGGTINQVDGNFCCWNDEGTVEFHWQGKMRGPGFEPLHFQIMPVACERLKDSDGDPIPTVIAVPLDRTETERRKNDANADRLKVLEAYAKTDNPSMREIATRCGWRLATNDPNKMKVQRHVKDLKTLGLLETGISEGNYRATSKGRKLLKERGGADA